jgi:hypothetical protein
MLSSRGKRVDKQLTFIAGLDPKLFIQDFNINNASKFAKYLRFYFNNKIPSRRIWIRTIHQIFDYIDMPNEIRRQYVNELNKSNHRAEKIRDKFTNRLKDNKISIYEEIEQITRVTKYYKTGKCILFSNHGNKVNREIKYINNFDSKTLECIKSIQTLKPTNEQILALLNEICGNHPIFSYYEYQMTFDNIYDTTYKFLSLFLEENQLDIIMTIVKNILNKHFYQLSILYTIF